MKLSFLFVTVAIVTFRAVWLKKFEPKPITIGDYTDQLGPLIDLDNVLGLVSWLQSSYKS